MVVFSDDFGALWYSIRRVVKVKRKLFKALCYYFKLLLFGAESFVFQFAIQKFKNQDI